MSRSRLSTIACGLLAGGILIAAAAPSSAQDYDPDSQDDIVVQGHWGRVPGDAESLSQRVSYADLDLRYADDRRALRHRVEASARYLCSRLGEDESYASSLTPSCREAAVRDAMGRVGTFEADYAPGDTAWTEPRQASYDSRYP